MIRKNSPPFFDTKSAFFCKQSSAIPVTFPKNSGSNSSFHLGGKDWGSGTGNVLIGWEVRALPFLVCMMLQGRPGVSSMKSFFDRPRIDHWLVHRILEHNKLRVMGNETDTPESFVEPILDRS